jgi:hypothetical protein
VETRESVALTEPFLTVQVNPVGVVHWQCVEVKNVREKRNDPGVPNGNPFGNGVVVFNRREKL